MVALELVEKIKEGSEKQENYEFAIDYDFVEFDKAQELLKE